MTKKVKTPDDVAVVVRCKGCKHYRNHPNGLCYLHTEPKETARGYSGDAVCKEDLRKARFYLDRLIDSAGDD